MTHIIREVCIHLTPARYLSLRNLLPETLHWNQGAIISIIMLFQLPLIRSEWPKTSLIAESEVGAIRQQRPVSRF